MIKPISIIVADTAFIIRKGLSALIKEHDNFVSLAEVSDTKTLLNSLKKNTPDVLIIDHCCDDCFSIQIIEKIKTSYPLLNILVISHEKSYEEIHKVIELGIKNYLLKDCNEKEIIDAITCCAKGQKYFCGQIIDVLLDREVLSKNKCESGGITEREIEIIQSLVSGKRTQEIANNFNISYHTVNTHKKNIYKKLGINHSYELVQYALKTGLMNINT